MVTERDIILIISYRCLSCYRTFYTWKNELGLCPPTHCPYCGRKGLKAHKDGPDMTLKLLSK